MLFPEKNRLLKTLLATSVLLSGFFLFSCSSSSDGKSFTAQLDSVDYFIRMGQVNDAYDMLKKAQKQAYSAYARLGIYKRYMILGEKDDALKVLKEAYKKVPENEEIRAVYGQYLLRNGDLNEALTVTQPLAGGRYGSLNAEAVLKLSSAKINDNKEYLNAEYIPVFCDAWEKTKDNAWLKNAALIYLSKGEYGEAGFLQEDYNFDRDEDAYFWALVQYDAERFDVCIENLQLIKKPSLQGKSLPLMADCYYFLEDPVSSEVCRETLVKLARSDSSIGVPTSALVNSAIYLKKNEKFTESYEYLMTAVNNNPQYIPGLITYSRFAYEDSLPHLMSELELAVRQTTLRTAKMREYDSRPKFNVDDALDKMNKVLAQQYAETKRRNDVLLVEEAQLYLKANKELPLKTKLSYVWNKLEENGIARNIYPARLVQFAVHELIKAEEPVTARALFTNYIDSKYNLKEADLKAEHDPGVDVFGAEKEMVKIEIPESVLKAAFGDRTVTALTHLEPWECELAAYFTLTDGNGRAAQRLYEYAVFETGAKNGNISSDVSVSSAMNLAMIYSSTGEKDRALEVYGLASGKAKDISQKSDIMYRMGCIQYGMGRNTEALLNLDYAIALDKSNASARLLKSKISRTN